MNHSTSARYTNRLSTLLKSRLVPVLRYKDIETAAYAAEVAIQAGCTTLELTWTIPGVVSLLKTLKAKHAAHVLLGVGTILEEKQALEALEAGADFLVCPGCLPHLVERAHEAEALCLLGAFTPTEVMAARREKADIVKIFPADSVGPSHLRALKSVFPDTFFCPTGGVNQINMQEYFSAGAALVGIGSQLYDQEAFSARDTASLVRQITLALEIARV